jgi:cell division septum initiation protein DivIVA
MAGFNPMKPIYLPKRQGMESDEDYDTGIVQNEENLNQNLNALYGAIAALQGENETLKATVASLRTQLNGK